MPSPNVTAMKKAVSLSVAFFLAFLFVAGPGEACAAEMRLITGLDGVKVRDTGYPEKDSLLLSSGLRQNRHAQ